MRAPHSTVHTPLTRLPGSAPPCSCTHSPPTGTAHGTAPHDPRGQRASSEWCAGYNVYRPQACGRARRNLTAKDKVEVRGPEERASRFQFHRSRRGLYLSPKTISVTLADHGGGELPCAAARLCSSPRGPAVNPDSLAEWRPRCKMRSAAPACGPDRARHRGCTGLDCLGG